MRQEALRHSAKMAVMAILLSSMSAFANDVSKTDSRTAMAQPGHALLMMEDLKTLLGLKARDPSSMSPLTQDGVSGGVAFKLKLSASEVARIRTAIQKTEAERNALVAKLQKEAVSKKSELRTQRRGVQQARLNARAEQDTSLSKSLFENLLQEANVDAQLEKSLSEFDSQHVVKIDFVDSEGERNLEAIHIGENTAWSSASKLQVAAK